MCEARPFMMVENLFERASQIWLSLTPEDWIEVIGSQITAKITTSARPDLTENHLGLAQAVQLYEEKFGIIFLPDSGEDDENKVLQECLDRLGNPASIELGLAAKVRQQITEKSLNKLLEK